MYARHSLSNRVSIDISNSQIGELDINFSSKKLKTKTLTSKHVRVGNSFDKLTEFSIYNPGIETSEYNFALVQFKDNKLTTTYPFINLSELGGTNINTSNLSTNSYLGLVSDGYLVNTSRPEFRISDLGDVDNLSLSPDVDGYVLSSYTVNRNSTKDPFKEKYYYSWRLRQEANKLLECEDVLKKPTQPYQVLRTLLPLELKGQGVENVRLQIAYDRSPELSNHLQGNSRAIFNVQYTPQVLNLTGNLVTAQLDCNNYNMFIIKCNDVNLLTLGFEYANDNYYTLVPISICIENFAGAIRFSNKVEFENGAALSLLGTTHILNCLIYNTGSNLVIRVLQKATNLSKVPQMML